MEQENPDNHNDNNSLRPEEEKSPGLGSPDLTSAFVHEVLLLFSDAFNKLHRKYTREPLNKGKIKAIKKDVRKWACIIAESFFINIDSAWELLRRAHVLFYEKFLWDPRHDQPIKIEKEFAYIPDDYHLIPDFTGFKSTQAFLGNADQKPRNCYHRWEGGLCALRKHTFGVKKNNGSFLPGLTFYHCSSPVPYEEPDFKKRLAGTEEGYQQFFDIFNNEENKKEVKKPLAEIRLLSPVKNMPGEDKQQILEHYLARVLQLAKPEYQEEPLLFFVYGINFARKFYNYPFSRKQGLQSCINIASAIELFYLVFQKSNIKLDPVLLGNYAKFKGNKINFARTIKTFIYDDNQSEQIIKENFSDYLKENLDFEKQCFFQFKDYFLNYKENFDPAVFQDLKLFIDWIESGDYKDAKLNGQIQALLIRLTASKLDCHTVVGCNDAKDRDGVVSITAEANEMFNCYYKRYPYTDLKEVEQDRKIMRGIQAFLKERSTPGLVAEKLSMPGFAKGFENFRQPFSGYLHLGKKDPWAGVFKKIYSTCYSKKTAKQRTFHFSLEPLNNLIKKIKEENKNFAGIVKAKIKGYKSMLISPVSKAYLKPKSKSDQLQKIILMKESNKFEEYYSTAFSSPEQQKVFQSSEGVINVFKHKVHCCVPRHAADEPARLLSSSLDSGRINQQQKICDLIEKTVDEALRVFYPQIKSVEDLKFKGTPYMVSMAKTMAEKKIKILNTMLHASAFGSNRIFNS